MYGNCARNTDEGQEKKLILFHSLLIQINERVTECLSKGRQDSLQGTCVWEERVERVRHTHCYAKNKSLLSPLACMLSHVCSVGYYFLVLKGLKIKGSRSAVNESRSGNV